MSKVDVIAATHGPCADRLSLVVELPCVWIDYCIFQSFKKVFFHFEVKLSLISYQCYWQFLFYFYCIYLFTQFCMPLVISNQYRERMTVLLKDILFVHLLNVLVITKLYDMLVSLRFLSPFEIIAHTYVSQMKMSGNESNPRSLPLHQCYLPLNESNS